MAIKLRLLTGEEKAAIEELARSRTAAARAVERARIILCDSRGKRVPAIAEELELTETTDGSPMGAKKARLPQLLVVGICNRRPRAAHALAMTEPNAGKVARSIWL